MNWSGAMPVISPNYTIGSSGHRDINHDTVYYLARTFRVPDCDAGRQAPAHGSVAEQSELPAAVLEAGRPEAARSDSAVTRPQRPLWRGGCRRSRDERARRV